MSSNCRLRTARALAEAQIARSHGADGVAHLGDGVLGVADEFADLLVEAGGALGQIAHFFGDDREAATGFAGTRGLDRSIEREQIGLIGDRLDVAEQVEDRIELAHHLVDLADRRRALPAHLGQ
jgi:hypothetical protein